MVQKYLTLYAISKEVRPHCIIFKLNWLITKKNEVWKNFPFRTWKYVLCHDHITSLSRKLLFGQLHVLCMCILLHCLRFTFEASSCYSKGMGGSLLLLTYLVPMGFDHRIGYGKTINETSYLLSGQYGNLWSNHLSRSTTHEIVNFSYPLLSAFNPVLQNRCCQVE